MTSAYQKRGATTHGSGIIGFGKTSTDEPPLNPTSLLQIQREEVRIAYVEFVGGGFALLTTKKQQSRSGNTTIILVRINCKCNTRYES
jgi:hypothetical protein